MGAAWVGVDVGGRRKGFHVAVVGPALHVTMAAAATVEHCFSLLRDVGPSVVAIDSPCGWAEAGEASRGCERDFAGAGLCGIRFTPDVEAAGARTDRHYEWIEHGLELWGQLRHARLRTIECFPTASWTAWVGPRHGRTRARWTREAIAGLASEGMAGLGAATNQDLRDAVAAALTARQWDRRRPTTDCFGDLVVPRAGSLPAALR